MPKFRKKPVEIEAVQWTGDNTSEVIDWVLATGTRSARWHEFVPGVEPDENGKGCDPIPEHIAVDTLEGTMWALVGDWIIRGIQGEHYPCKPDIFEATYEPVGSDDIAHLRDIRDALRQASLGDVFAFDQQHGRRVLITVARFHEPVDRGPVVPAELYQD